MEASQRNEDSTSSGHSSRGSTGTRCAGSKHREEGAEVAEDYGHTLGLRVVSSKYIDCLGRLNKYKMAYGKKYGCFGREKGCRRRVRTVKCRRVMMSSAFRSRYSCTPHHIMGRLVYPEGGIPERLALQLFQRSRVWHVWTLRQ